MFIFLFHIIDYHIICVLLYCILLACSYQASLVLSLLTTSAVTFRELVGCHALSLNEGGVTLHYIELAINVDAGVLGQEPIKRPRVRCDSGSITSWVCTYCNVANLY